MTSTDRAPRDIVLTLALVWVFYVIGRRALGLLEFGRLPSLSGLFVDYRFLLGDALRTLPTLLVAVLLALVVARKLQGAAPRYVLPVKYVGAFIFWGSLVTSILGPILWRLTVTENPVTLTEAAATVLYSQQTRAFRFRHLLSTLFGAALFTYLFRTHLFSGAPSAFGFDGSPESIEALQRFAPGSAPSRADAAQLAEPPPDIRRLSPEAAQELIARVNAGERYEDVAASLLARGAARPVEAVEEPPRPPSRPGKLGNFDDL